MTYGEFVNNYNGRGVDYDSAYGNQCVDLILFYLRDVYGFTGFSGNAKDWYYNYGGALAQRFDRVTNNPNDYNQVPKQGDIIIWDGGLAGSGGYGHIAIYDGKVSPGVFRSFDQNWGGQYAHFVTHNYGNVIGWLTPKATPTQGGTEVANRDQVNNLYKGILFRDGDPGGLNNYTGRDANTIVAEMLGSAERKALETRVNGATAQIQNLQTAINQQNQIITDLNSQSNATKAQYQEAVAKLADLNAQLAKATDTIKDLQNNPDTKLLDEGKGVFAWFSKLIERLKK